MNTSFNKKGSLEFEKNFCKYRIETAFIPQIADTAELKEELKQGIYEWKDDSEHLVSIMNAEFLNHFLVIYYNVANLQPITYLKQLDFKEKITYFKSLINLFKKYEEIPFVLEKLNFFVDPLEENVKIIFYETPSLTVYDKSVKPETFLRNLICSTFTYQDEFTGLPKRADFINPSERNINFVRDFFQLDNLEDMYFLIEKHSIEFTVESIEEEPFEEIADKKKKKSIKSKKAPKVQKNKISQHNRQHNTKQQNKKIDKKIIGIIIAIVGALGFYLYMTVATSTNDTEVVINADQPKSENFESPEEIQNEILKAYQAIYKNDVEGAYKILSVQEKLSVDDIPVLIEVYYRYNKLSELLDKKPNVADDVINYLIANDSLSSIIDLTVDMQTKNPYIEFEKAVINGNHKEVLKLKDEISLNGRRDAIIVNAYLSLNDVPNALKFANETKNPYLIKTVTDSMN